MPWPPEKQGHLTYADYLAWPSDERWELIEGEAFDMSPAPSERHQRVLGELFLQVRLALGGPTCRVYMAPFDVRLHEAPDAPDDAVRSVVQPDLSVICRPERLDQAGCRGAPDLVVEILSPSTSFKDQTHKLRLYEKYGVGEYWLVNPNLEVLLVYRRESPTRFARVREFRREDTLTCAAVDGLVVDLARVFADPGAPSVAPE